MELTKHTFDLNDVPWGHNEHSEYYISMATEWKPEQTKICILVFSQNSDMLPRYYLATKEKKSLVDQLNLPWGKTLVFGTVCRHTCSQWRAFGIYIRYSSWTDMLTNSVPQEEGVYLAAWIIDDNIHPEPLPVYTDRFQQWGHEVMVCVTWSRQQKLNFVEDVFEDREFEWQRNANGKYILVVKDPVLANDHWWADPLSAEVLRDPCVVEYAKYHAHRSALHELVQRSSRKHENLLHENPNMTAIQSSHTFGGLYLVDGYMSGEHSIESYDHMTDWIAIHGNTVVDDEVNMKKFVSFKKLIKEADVQFEIANRVKLLRYNRMLWLLSDIECALPFMETTFDFSTTIPGITLRPEQADVLTEVLRRETDPETSFERQLLVQIAESGTKSLYFSPVLTQSFVGDTSYVPKRFGGLIVADVGWGKTVLTYALIAASERVGTTLVVVPNKVMLSQWKAMCDSMTTLTSYAYEKNANQQPLNFPRTAPHVVFTTTALLKKDSWLQSHPWTRVVYDEVHELHKSGAPWKVNTNVIWGLTGTVCHENKPNITNIVSALTGPDFTYERLGTERTYVIDEVFLRLFAVKAPRASQIPGEPTWSVNESTVTVSLSPALRVKYDHIQSQLWAQDWSSTDKISINRLHKVAAGFYGVSVPARKASSDPSKKRKMPETVYEDTECPICMEAHTQPMVIQCGHGFCKHCIDTWRAQQNQSARNKCPICRMACETDPMPMQVVKIHLDPSAAGMSSEPTEQFDPYRVNAAMDIIAGTDKIVVFSQYKEVLTSLSRELSASRIMYVDLSKQTWTRDAETLASSLNFFQTNPGCKVMLLNTKTHSTGLNLTSANSVLFMERPTDPTWYVQGMGRVARQGQTRDITVQILLSDIPNVVY